MKVNKFYVQVIISIIIMSALLVLLQYTLVNAYNKYKQSTDLHKEKCLGKFKTIDYEVVSGVLYCKTGNGLVKFN